MCPRAAMSGDAARRRTVHRRLGNGRSGTTRWASAPVAPRGFAPANPADDAPGDVAARVSTSPPPGSEEVAEMRRRLKEKQQALMDKLAVRKELQMELRDAVSRKHPELANEVVPRDPSMRVKASAAVQAPPPPTTPPPPAGPPPPIHYPFAEGAPRSAPRRLRPRRRRRRRPQPRP